MPKRKVKPPAPPKLIRRAVAADGTTTLHLRWHADSDWIQVLSTADHPMGEVNNLQAVASVPIVRVCYLDAIAPLQADTKRYLTGYHTKLCFPEVLDKKEFVR